MSEPESIDVILHLFSETGTEGGDWACMDKRFITPVDPLPPGTPDGPSGAQVVVFFDGTNVIMRDLLLSELPREQWSYEGLIHLDDGDRLTIYDKEDPAKIVWDGEIKLIQHPLFTEHTSCGMWIHADQDGVARDVWEKFFLEKYPAKLIKARR